MAPRDLAADIELRKLDIEAEVARLGRVITLLDGDHDRVMRASIHHLDGLIDATDDPAFREWLIALRKRLFPKGKGMLMRRRTRTPMLTRTQTFRPTPAPARMSAPMLRRGCRRRCFGAARAYFRAEQASFIDHGRSGDVTPAAMNPIGRDRQARKRGRNHGAGIEHAAASVARAHRQAALHALLLDLGDRRQRCGLPYHRFQGRPRVLLGRVRP